MEPMKDSGVEWIGQIPESWDVGRIAHRYELALGKMVEQDAGEALRNEYPYLSAVNIKWSGIDTSTKKEMYFNNAEKRQYAVKKDDLLITEGGAIGTSCIYKDEFGECYMQNSVIRARGKDALSNHFLRHWLEFVCGSGYLDALCNKATIAHYTKEKVGKTPFVLIPKDESQAIAKYLDEILKPLSEQTDILEHQISTLESYKSSLIHEAVTKGLDPNAPTKPSGVEWIGDKPTHWKVKRLKYVCETASGTTPESANNDYYDGEINWIQSGDLYQVADVFSTDKTVTTKALNECSALRVYKAPFVVVAMYGASIGNSALSRIDACVNQACCSLHPSKTIKVNYLRYVFIDAKEDLKRQAIGGTQPNISQVLIRNEKIPLPPEAEQKTIAEYLDKHCSKIDDILDIKRQQVEVLKKRRQSLIYEYVTGKRRVTQEA